MGGGVFDFFKVFPYTVKNFRCFDGGSGIAEIKVFADSNFGGKPVNNGLIAVIGNRSVVLNNLCPVLQNAGTDKSDQTDGDNQKRQKTETGIKFGTDFPPVY
jgi:hypothetical protein